MLIFILLSALKLKIDLLTYPLYILNLAPSDYHLFTPLKVSLKRGRLTSDQELNYTLLSQKNILL